MTGDQARQARELLGLTKFRLSQQSGMPVGTIERFERTGIMTERKIPYMSAECRRAKLQVVLEAAGAVFDGEPASVIGTPKSGKPALTGAQLLQARRLLLWTARALSERCGVAAGTIRRFERTNRMARSDPQLPPVDRLTHIRFLLEDAGVEFTSAGGLGLRSQAIQRITGVQVREARRLLGWSGRVLADRSGIIVGVIGHFERTNKMMKPHTGRAVVDRIAHLQAVLEAAGVEFIKQNSGEQEVQLRERSSGAA